ncbi:MAG: knotted carbamoyltransferase YgeW [Verrucomicrobia bacterium]|nr:knotted carbamoyltransferase YgeW [Kiritimatiellia bacterium]MCO6400883.1 knotted carbamoyltransferase YgeW [Verrucomicrobiota bacterium]
MSTPTSILASLRERPASLFGKDFLLTWDHSLDQLKLVLGLAETLRLMHQQGISARVFKSGLAVSNFRDNSTRTRFSFASASNLLGLAVQDLDEGKSQIAHGETVRETATMISFLTEVIGIRDDMFLGAGHTYMLEVAAALDESFGDGVLAQRPGIVNLQCDIDHPTQSMADLLWLEKTFGSLGNLRGKKIAMTWAYSPSYGKPLSVPQGIIGLMSRFGMKVALAHPKGYDLIPEVVQRAERQAQESGGSFTHTHSMEEAFEDADIVYPKSWASYSVMQKRTTLLQQNDREGLKELEKACLAENASHTNWECTASQMKRTKGGDALYMHCLPADITGVSCKQGEVEADVFEKYRIRTYHEAGRKPFIIAAMILANRAKDPIGVLEGLLKKNKPRVDI